MQSTFFCQQYDQITNIHLDSLDFRVWSISVKTKGGKGDYSSFTYKWPKVTLDTIHYSGNKIFGHGENEIWGNLAFKHIFFHDAIHSWSQLISTQVNYKAQTFESVEVHIITIEIISKLLHSAFLGFLCFFNLDALGSKDELKLLKKK